MFESKPTKLLEEKDEQIRAMRAKIDELESNIKAQECTFVFNFDAVPVFLSNGLARME
jgi:hypothetical protein